MKLVLSILNTKNILKIPEDKMVMNFVSYKLCKLFVCLMRFQMFFVCIYHFPQFTPLLLRP
jgi:hypothetical protein